jgi:hypothetical protein
MFIAFAHGLIVVAGVIVTVKHLLTLRPAAQAVVEGGDAG